MTLPKGPPVTENLPTMPEPFDYCYEWDGPYGTRKFSVAAHNGRKPDRSVSLYTADQLRERDAMWADQLRAAVMEERERKLAHNVLAMADAVRAAYDDCATVATSEDPRTSDWMYDDYDLLAAALRKRGEETVAHLEGMVARETARPLSEYHEDFGSVLWWWFPINEPPYVGSPQCSDWPGYHTHWTPLPPVPKEPQESAAAIREGVK